MDWDAINPMSLVNLPPTTATDSSGLGPAPVAGRAPIYHPDNPVFWFGLLTAVAVGLAGVSTHLRVGPFKAGLDAGTA